MNSRARKIDENSWEQVQAKTFTKWINTQLARWNIAGIEDVLRDLSDGTALLQLLEVIGEESIGRFNINPVLRIQKVENMNRALVYVRNKGLNLTNIGAEDIVDYNSKITLGLIWKIILHFTISDIIEEGLTAKDALLLWCQRKTAEYKEVRVADFSYSWQDGLAFCALIHKHRPDLLDYYKLDFNQPVENTKLAFEVAEKHLGIPKLLDAEDICLVKVPDDKSIMTYVAQYFHAFSSHNKLEMAKRRIDKFTNTVQIANAMKRDYMDRARRLIEKIQLLQAEFECTKTKSRQLNDVTELITSFEEYCKHGRKQIVAEKLELNGLAGDIITKLMAYQSNRNLEADIITASEQIETEWKRLCQQETTYNTALNAAVIELKDKASREIGQFANQIYESIIRIHNEISEITCYGGDNNETEVEALDQQGDQLSKLILVVESFEKELEQLQAMESECRQMQIDCTVYTIHSSQSIVADLELIKQTLLKKKSYLVNQTLLRNVSNITPAQLDEFESVFYHFDKGDCNSLNAAEFRAALEALDLAYSESEFTEIFEFLAQGNDAQRISFEKYIRFLVAVFEDKDDYAQLFESFHTVASGKPYVSITDLKAAGLSEASISKLACDMPKYEGDDLLLDYVSYIKSLN